MIEEIRARQRPLREAQRIVNRGLYLHSREVYNGISSKEFFTPFEASANFLKNSIAKEQKKGTLKNEIRLLEFGGGNGSLAKHLLDALEKSDLKKNTDYYKRSVYFYVDYTDSMLKLAKKNLLMHKSKIEFLKADCEKPHPNKIKDINFIFAHGVWRVLSTTCLSNKNDQLSELYIAPCSKRPAGQLNEVEKRGITKFIEEWENGTIKTNPKRQQQLINFEHSFAETKLGNTRVPGNLLGFLKKKIRSLGETEILVINTGGLANLKIIMGLLCPGGTALISDLAFTETSGFSKKAIKNMDTLCTPPISFPINLELIQEACEKSGAKLLAVPLWQFAEQNTENITRTMIGKDVAKILKISGKSRFYAKKEVAQQATDALQKYWEKWKTEGKKGRLEKKIYEQYALKSRTFEEFTKKTLHKDDGFDSLMYTIKIEKL